MIRTLYKKYEVYVVGFILCIILAWAGFVRVYHLGFDSLWIDEGYTINAAQGILQHGYPLLDSGQQYRGHIASSYLIAGSIGILGLDPFHPWQARIPQVLASIVAIYIFFRASYLTTKNLTASLIATICFAFFEWHIAWDRQARGYAEMQMFLIAAYYAIVHWFEFRKKRAFVFAVICVAGAILFQGVAMVTLPLLILFPCVYLLTYRPNLKSFLSLKLFLAVIGTGLIFLKLIVPRIPAIEPLGYETSYLAFFLTTFLTYIIVCTIGILAALKNKQRKFLAIIIPLIWITIPGIIIMWYSQVIQFRYLLVISPFIFTLTATAISEIISLLKKYSDKYLPVSATIILGFFLIQTLHLLPSKSYQLEAGSPQPSFNSAYDLIKKTKSIHDLVISPYTQLTKIYLDQPGYWLPISLTGRPNEIAKYTFNGKDYYSNAPKIESPAALTKLINSNRGYIILDSMARARLDTATINAIEKNPRVTLVMQKNSPGGTIQVFHFN